MTRVRVLVTGGAGFLGAHLCRRLVDAGLHVIAMDNFSTGATESIEDLLARPHFELLGHDVAKPYDLAVDHVYNLACPASPRHYQRDPVQTTLTSVQGTYHALLVAQRHRARFLQSSTSEVYGDPEEHPQRESYRGNVSSTGPRGCYDEGKRCAEALVMDFHRSRGVDVRIARVFDTYGPGMHPDDGRVVSNFVTQALRAEPLTVYGDGSQTRSLCYVSDMIDGLVGLMEQEEERGPVNLGDPIELPVREIAERVIALVGGGRIVHRPLPADDPRRRCPDISLAQRLFGFAPRTPVDEGLAHTVEYFRRRLGLEVPSHVTS